MSGSAKSGVRRGRSKTGSSSSVADAPTTVHGSVTTPAKRNYFGLRSRTIRNRHKSARKAVAAWLKGSLWGSPIWMGPSKCRVYGCNQRSWRTCMVEFYNDRITIVRAAEIVR